MKLFAAQTRFLSVVLFVFSLSLLTACSSNAETTPAESIPDTASSCGDLRILDIGDNSGMYSNHFSYAINRQLLSYIDYASAQQLVLCASPNCTHSDDSCTAWIPPDTSVFPQILDDDHLILIQSSSNPERTCIYLSNRDGGSRQQLLPDQAGWDSIQGLSSPFRDKNLADDHYFYYVQKVLDEQLSSSYTLYRVPLDGSPAEPLFEMPASYILLGVHGRNLILMETILNEPPFPEFPEGASPEEKQQIAEEYDDMMAQEGSALDHLILLNVDTGKKQEIKSWNTQYSNYGASPTVLWANDRIFWCSEQNATVLHWLTLDGESGEIPITLPPVPEGAAEASCSLNLLLDDHLLLSIAYIQENDDVHSCWAALDLKSGECSSIPLYCMSNGHEIPVPIRCVTADHLLVETDIDNTCTQVVAPDRDGNPTVWDAYRDQFGFIRYEDFFAGLPHYQSIQMLPIT